MKKHYKILAAVLPVVTAAMMMAACTSDDFVGDQEVKRQIDNGMPISFDLVSAPQTRAPETGATAAGLLNNNFVIWGVKTSGETKSTVFHNYQVNYVANSANTTTSNSANWEYVGYNNVPGGVTTNVGVTAFATSGSNSGVEQSIKYWDYSASPYEFIAYSLGKGAEVTPATDPKTYTYATSTAMSSYTFDLSGSKDELSACYISDLYTKTDMSASNTQVQLKFRKMESKVRIGLYEIVPGYSVKDVKFYQSASAATPGTEAYLYSTASGGSFPKSGTFTVSYTPPSTATTGHTPATVTWKTSGVTPTYDSEIDFGDAVTTSGTTWTGWAGKEYQETNEAVYLGRASNAATQSAFVSVLPNPGNSDDLNLKVDYTLVSRDGYGENIKVTGATAVVPAAYAKWAPNYNYTYLFKISNNTNGSTGQSILGLSPITLDAQVVTDELGSQETITTVTNTSITTYQNGSSVLTKDEYNPGTIYVVVGSGTELTSSNAKLYTAAVTLESGATANVTEAVVANAIANPTGAKDGNGNALTVTEVGSEAADKLEAISEIPASDTPNNVAISINGAKFAAAAAANTTVYYVFEYTDGTTKVYKVIKVQGATS